MDFKPCELGNLVFYVQSVAKTENIHTEWSYSEFWKGVKNRAVSDTVLQKFKWKKYSSYFCVYGNSKLDKINKGFGLEISFPERNFHDELWYSEVVIGTI